MIVILDFGSQYTQLIARRIRELNVFSEILPYNTCSVELLKKSPSGIILSGGPASVISKNSPTCDTYIFNLGIPVLGICYGMQLLAKIFGGKVVNGKLQEYGKSEICVDRKNLLFHRLPKQFNVWMSHSDRIKILPKGFVKIAETKNIEYAAFMNLNRNLYGVQFHPEVVHTEYGKKLLENFVFNIAKSKKDWNLKSFISQEITEIRKKVQNSKVICGLSGGVDSSTTAMILKKAISKNVIPIFVDNGLLRKEEPERIRNIFGKKFRLEIHFVEAQKVFLKKLKYVTNPERKRKIIGRLFVEVFEKEAKKIKDAKFLAQGTLYPDLIESQPVKGPSSKIKSHHNVGGLPEKMNLELVEPLKFLFKDEVRTIAKQLGLPNEIVYRQPFPGPGLAIRIIGEITEEKLKILKDADYILIDEMKKSGYYYKVWQSFAILLPVKTVGIKGDRRSYENVITIRIVESTDGMTADFSRVPYQLLEKISTRIVNEVKGVNRVVYDITSKPPATIEWE
ncbi:MAG: glutamine-hydrolyzing GMP synthase [Elusimicrobiota bacterium]